MKNGKKVAGRGVLRSALDQWMVVEQIQNVCRKVLPKKELEELEAETSCKATRSRQVLKDTEEKRTPTGEEEDPTEEVLRGVLDRLRVPCKEDECKCGDPQAA